MATVTPASTCNTKLSNTLDSEKNSIPHLIDISFSSYLGNEEDTFASMEPQCQLGLGTEKTNNGEISIFRAEKYYNGAMDEKKKTEIAKNSVIKHQSKVHLQNVKLKIGPGTPSVSSESSWNSHKALLPEPYKERPRSVAKVVNGKRLLTIFSCKCSCSDEKSVEVDETIKKNNRTSSERNVDYGQVQAPHDQISLVGTKQTQTEAQFKEQVPCPNLELQKEDSFAFPVISSGIDTLNMEKPVHEEEEGKDRRSLEVFGSPLSDDGGRALSLERRLAMLTWSVTHSIKDIAATSVSSEVYDDFDDVESDSSSDLFEIENFSTDAYPCYRPQAAENIPTTCVAHTACYQAREQSEKPMEVSLTTKSTAAKSTVVAKKVQKRHLNILMACRSHRAVNVAGELYRVSEKASTNRTMYGSASH